MRPAERDVVLLLLAVAAGSADGWSYVGLGHAFVANMTGNTVFLGLAVFKVHGDFLHPLISLGFYLVGTAVASYTARRSGQAGIWPRAIFQTLLAEALVLAGAEIAWTALQADSGSRGYWINPLLGSVAFAIGLQSGAMLQLRIPGIVTTYISGTWTILMSGVTRLLAGKQNPNRNERADFETRLFMQAGILAVYFLSAVLTGWLFRYEPSGVGALPAACVLAVSVYGLIRG